MNHNYGKHGEAKSNREKVQEYLGMIFFTEKGKVKTKLDTCVERMIHEIPMKLSKIDTVLTRASNNIF